MLYRKKIRIIILLALITIVSILGTVLTILFRFPEPYYDWELKYKLKSDSKTRKKSKKMNKLGIGQLVSLLNLGNSKIRWDRH